MGPDTGEWAAQQAAQLSQVTTPGSPPKRSEIERLTDELAEQLAVLQQLIDYAAIKLQVVTSPGSPLDEAVIAEVPVSPLGSTLTDSIHNLRMLTDRLNDLISRVQL